MTPDHLLHIILEQKFGTLPLAAARDLADVLARDEGLRRLAAEYERLIAAGGDVRVGTRQPFVDRLNRRLGELREAVPASRPAFSLRRHLRRMRVAYAGMAAGAALFCMLRSGILTARPSESPADRKPAPQVAEQPAPAKPESGPATRPRRR